MKWTKTPNPVPADWPSAAKGNGLNICFGRHSGYGGYSEVARGGRHIVIHEDALGGDNAIETWNRLEDGAISGRVMLNSTYGSDKYARVDVKLSDGSIPKGGIAGRSDDDGPKTTVKKPHSSTSAKSSKTTKATKTTASSKVAKATMTSKHIDTIMASTISKNTTTTTILKASKTTKTTSRSKSNVTKSASTQHHHEPRSEGVHTPSASKSTKSKLRPEQTFKPCLPGLIGPRVRECV
jgi:hypothetical protein